MILDNSFPPDDRVEKEAISLIDAGHEVFLFSLDFRNLGYNETYKGIHVKRYGAGKIIYKASALAYTFPLFKWLVAPKIKHFLKNNLIDSIHIHDMVIAGAVFEANRTLKLKVILDLHENRPEIMRDYKHVNSLKGRLLINLSKWKKKYFEFASKSDAVIVVTELAKQDLLKTVSRNPDTIVVVPNTVSLNEFVNYPIDESILKRMEGTFNLLYIGDTSLRRGTDTAIFAIKELVKEIPNICLWIVGRSSADSELVKLVKDLNLEKYVIFEGWQNADKLPSYIIGCNIALSPIKRNIHHDTTYANKVFQYMAMGRVMIVSDCLTQADLIDETSAGLTFEAGNHLDLSSKVLKLFNNEKLSQQLGDNGAKAVNAKWNWKTSAKDLVDLYD